MDVSYLQSAILKAEDKIAQITESMLEREREHSPRYEEGVQLQDSMDLAVFEMKSSRLKLESLIAYPDAPYFPVAYWDDMSELQSFADLYTGRVDHILFARNPLLLNSFFKIQATQMIITFLKDIRGEKTLLHPRVLDCESFPFHQRDTETFATLESGARLELRSAVAWCYAVSLKRIGLKHLQINSNDQKEKNNQKLLSPSSSPPDTVSQKERPGISNSEDGPVPRPETPVPSTWLPLMNIKAEKC